MDCTEDAVKFVTEWWELSGDIVTTLAALRKLKHTYPSDYLVAFCHPGELASRAAALQEICQYLDDITNRRVRR